MSAWKLHLTFNMFDTYNVLSPTTASNSIMAVVLLLPRMTGFAMRLYLLNNDGGVEKHLVLKIVDGMDCIS